MEKSALTGQNIDEDYSKTDLPNWDLFKNEPPDEEYIPVEEKRWYRHTIITFKILAYILTFAVVLGGAVFSKFGIVLMAGRLKPDRFITTCEGNGTATTQIPIPQEEQIYWTWLLFMAFAVPEFFVFFRSVRFWFFKGQEKPTWLEFGVPLIFELLHTVGLSLFVFCILPNLDSAKAVVLCSTVYFVPGVLSIFTGIFKSGWSVYRGVDIAATFFQGTVIFMWVLFPEKSEQNMWLLPICIILISLGFWTNYVDECSEFGFITQLDKLKPNLLKNGYFIYTWISLFKVIVFFSFILVSLEIQGEISVNTFLEKSGAAWRFEPNTTYSGGIIGLPNQNKLNIWQSPLLLQVFGGLLCYVFAKYACKIGIQHVSFAAPISLAMPVTVLLVLLLDSNDICFFNTPYFGTMRFIPYTGNLFGKNHAYIWILWWISQIWLTIHIWFPKSERLARTEKLFVVPMYNGILVDQSIGLNRRREISENDRRPHKYGETDSTSDVPIDPREKDDIPRIYACATMWHETTEEMIEIMKSILRMDEDQFIRRIALEQFNIIDGYYEYETHIFFDDAFVLSDPEDWNSPQILNTFVKDFILIINEAAKHVHKKNPVYIPPPLKIPTPYGGRLEWTLPGQTRIICHLKDKSKIRHKKRWSQCMYMYYLLGYLLMENENLSKNRKDIRAKNTFILALDGDVDFQPIAVERLVDLMRKNHKLGAACGRIHPTGSTGLMLWYQKFEYATGHWLQKATEHMIGCVLCSPGCFSLFRGQALMSDNVMAKYTTVSKEPRHYVQYDQGEDRWLCTLILQQGYRVDYAAASDAYTHAPEEFDEFYNQRRRWVPSTTANIMDLLTDFKRTVRINPDISFLYIVYQFALMFGTIMGPGTIFLMIVGAVNTIFGVEKWTSFLINLVPILVYALVCYYAKSKTQLLLAKILSVAYALLMVAVLVGIAVLVSEEGLLSPSAIFLVIVASSFIISAIMHPLEFDCLIHGFVYFITIPSMYLLLIIFSVFNLNNVSWGTREGPKVKSKQELMAEQKEVEEMKVKQEKYGLFSFLREGKNDSEGSLEFSFAGLFKLMCCTHKNQDASRIATSLEHMTNRLEAMEKKMENLGSTSESTTVKRKSFQQRTGNVNTTTGTSRMETLDERSENTDSGDMSDIDLSKIQFGDEDEPKAKYEKRDDMKNPYWITDRILLRRKIDYLSKREIEFWNDLITKYLEPIEANKKKEKEMADALLALRNKCVFVFFMLNAMFVLLIWFLELKKKNLHVKWPFGNKELELEPIGFLFVAFFAVILIIQFIAMLFHRFATFSHILASTSLYIPIPWLNKTSLESIRKDKALFAKDAVTVVRKMIHDEGLDENENIIEEVPGPERNTVSNLYRTTRDTRAMESLDERFEKNFNRLSTLNPNRQTQFLKSSSIASNNKKENIVDNLINRRSRIMTIRKASALSGSSGASGYVQPLQHPAPPPVNYTTMPIKTLTHQNTLTIPTINEPSGGGVDNKGFTTSDEDSSQSSSSEGEEC